MAHKGVARYDGRRPYYARRASYCRNAANTSAHSRIKIPGSQQVGRRFSNRRPPKRRIGPANSRLPRRIRPPADSPAPKKNLWIINRPPHSYTRGGNHGENMKEIERGIKKICLLIGAWLILEIAVFIGLSICFGGWNVFWVMFLSCIAGFIIRPANANMAAMLTSPRAMFSTLLIVPGFLSDILAVIVVIPPLRKALTPFVTKRLIQKTLLAQFSETDPARFAQFMQNGFPNAGAPYGANAAYDAETVYDGVIDIDYDVKKSTPNAGPTVEIVRGGTPHPETRKIRQLPEN